MTVRQALLTALVWCGVASLIVVALYVGRSPREAAEFVGAFFMEETLSLDNLFMFFLIFSTFQTPAEARPRVLRWGILGVVLMRGAIIFSGTALISRFRPVLWLFSLFLLWSAFKLFFSEAEETELPPDQRQAALERNWLVRLARRFFPFEPRYQGQQFFTRADARLRGTLLLMTLLIIEGTDLLFAFDSLPAAMAVSQSFTIVLVSNVIAVLSLRALYFVLESMQERFGYMTRGIGLLLAIAGIKILLPDLGLIVSTTIGRIYPGITRTVPADLHVDVPLPVSLGVIVLVIAATFAWTLVKTRTPQAPADATEPPVVPESG